jgi:hypothetical protein
MAPPRRATASGSKSSPALVLAAACLGRAWPATVADRLDHRFRLCAHIVTSPRFGSRRSRLRSSGARPPRTGRAQAVSTDRDIRGRVRPRVGPDRVHWAVLQRFKRLLGWCGRLPLGGVPVLAPSREAYRCSEFVHGSYRSGWSRLPAAAAMDVDLARGSGCAGQRCVGCPVGVGEPQWAACHGYREPLWTRGERQAVQGDAWKAPLSARRQAHDARISAGSCGAST